MRRNFIVILFILMLLGGQVYAQEELSNVKSFALEPYLSMRADFEPRFEGIDFTQYKGTYGFDFETKEEAKIRFGYTKEEINLLQQKYPDGQVYQTNSIYKDESENKLVFELIMADMPADKAIEEYEARTGSKLLVTPSYDNPFHMHYIFEKKEDAESFIKKFDEAPKGPSIVINMAYWKLTEYPADVKSAEDQIADALYYESLSNPKYCVTFIFERSSMSSWDAWKDGIGMGYSGLIKAYEDRATLTDSSTMSAVIDVLINNDDVVLDSKVYQPQKGRSLKNLLDNTDIFQIK